MTQIWDCTDARPSLGVYVLGAIDPAERALVDAHLMSCRDCRDELAGLAGLPALLARVNPDEVSRICADDTVGTGTHADADDQPPDELIGTVLNLAEARRRRTRWRFVAAANSVTGVSGSVAYSKELWGDAFAVLVDHIPVGTTCQLWVVHPDGTRTQVAAWTTAKDEGEVWYSGSMPKTAPPISSFQITANHKVLLTATPT